MRAVRFDVSGELLVEALHLPLGAWIVGLSWSRRLDSAELIVADPTVPDAAEPHDVVPTVTHIREDFRWDWNLR